VQVGTNLHAYGKTFLAEWPEETTDLFITYYTGKYVPVKADVVEKVISPPPSISGALSSIRDAADITKYVQYIPYISDKPKSSPASSAKAVPSLPAQRTLQSSSSDNVPNGKAAAPAYHPPRPRAAFSIFVDFPGCFVAFLEALMEDSSFNGRDEKDVDDICTTLFEAYLREARGGKKEERAMWEDKAKALLTDRNVSPNPPPHTHTHTHTHTNKPPALHSRPLRLSSLSFLFQFTCLVFVDGSADGGGVVTCRHFPSCLPPRLLQRRNPHSP
jgi:vacuolar protein sorting-associated protein 11